MKNSLFRPLCCRLSRLPGVACCRRRNDRSAAIQLCRAEVTAQSGADADEVRLDQVHLRPRVVRVDFDVWRDGHLQNVRCEVTARPSTDDRLDHAGAADAPPLAR